MLKETHPTELAEFECAQGLQKAPAFNWWVPQVLKKRELIISKVKTRNARYVKRNEKFGIKMPKNMKEAKALEKENSNTLWQDAISKELADISVAFKLLENCEVIPRGSQIIKCHMIFDVDMEEFCQKAKLVAQGHMIHAPAAVTYASGV